MTVSVRQLRCRDPSSRSAPPCPPTRPTARPTVKKEDMCPRSPRHQRWNDNALAAHRLSGGTSRRGTPTSPDGVSCSPNCTSGSMKGRPPSCPRRCTVWAVSGSHSWRWSTSIGIRPTTTSSGGSRRNGRRRSARRSSTSRSGSVSRSGWRRTSPYPMCWRRCAPVSRTTGGCWSSTTPRTRKPSASSSRPAVTAGCSSRHGTCSGPMSRGRSRWMCSPARKASSCCNAVGPT